MTYLNQGKYKDLYYLKPHLLLKKQCETKFPLEYKKLKTDIDVAIDKFNIAYKPVEINGTKMKEILYGLNEFD